MKPARFLATAAVFPLMLSSCETTGDPSQGGLFGWSQQKANYRLAERQHELNSIQSDTDYQNRRTRELQAEKSRLERQRSSY